MKLLLLVIAGLAAASPAERTHAVEGVFRARAGARWTPRRDWAGRYPLYLLTRASGKDSRASILVESYAFGNRLYPTPARYLSAMDAAPREERPVSRGTRRIAGKMRTLWERAYAQPERLRADGSASRRPLLERFVVIEQDDGFLVARLKADEAEFAERSAEFDAFLASFEAR